MLRMILYRKLVARLLILVYLLVGLGLGNGLFWCQESGAFTHAEYSLSGECQFVQDSCLTAYEQQESDERLSPTPLLWSSSADHLDSPASHSLSHAPAPKYKDLPAAPMAADWSASRLLPERNLPVISLTGLNLAAQPPPSQTLAALRTVVLLN